MRSTTIKSRLNKAEACVARWRTRLKIDPKWEIAVVYVSDPPKDVTENDLCIFDDSSAQYWSVELQLMPEMMKMSSSAFKDTIDDVVLHELLHLLMWQFSSAATNLAGRKCQPELVKLEEQVIQSLEEIFKGVRWK